MIKTSTVAVPLINIALVFYAFFSGLHWDQLKVKSIGLIKLSQLNRIPLGTETVVGWTTATFTEIKDWQYDIIKKK